MMLIFLYILEAIVEILTILIMPPVSLIGKLFPNWSDTQSKPHIVIVLRWLSKNPLHYFWKTYLENRGISTVYLYYPLQKGTFRSSAEMLKEYIESQNLSNIVLVGVSSGGITCYSYLQEFNGWSRVKQFISIGTPFYGTPKAYLLPFIPYMKAITPQGEVIKELSKQEVKNPEKIINITAKFDEMVPSSSSNLPGAKHITIAVVGHNNLHTLNKETYDIITRYTAE